MRITHGLTINGPGQGLLTIDAQENSRFFNITAASGDFAITDLSLTRGRVVGSNSPSGGAINMDGAGNLTVERVSITASSAIWREQRLCHRMRRRSVCVTAARDTYHHFEHNQRQQCECADNWEADVKSFPCTVLSGLS